MAHYPRYWITAMTSAVAYVLQTVVAAVEYLCRVANDVIQPDARTSLELDRIAISTSEPVALTRAKAFVARAMLHDEYSAGGFSAA